MASLPWRLSNVGDFRLETTLEDLMNRQIQLELQAFYTYLSMVTTGMLGKALLMAMVAQAAYFERDDVALPGFRKFFRAAADEELGHATRLISALAMRGSPVTFGVLENPCDNDVGPSSSPHDDDDDGDDGGAAAGDGGRGGTSARLRVRGGQDLAEGRGAGADGGPQRLRLGGAPQRRRQRPPPRAQRLAPAQASPPPGRQARRHQRPPPRPPPSGRWGRERALQTTNLIEEYLDEGAASVKELSDLLTRLRNVQPCLGHHIIDQELLAKE